MLDGDEHGHTPAHRACGRPDEDHLAQLQRLDELHDVVHLGVDVVILVGLGIIGHAGSQPIQREDVVMLGKTGNILHEIIGAGVAGKSLFSVDQDHRLALPRFVVARPGAVDVHEFGLQAADGTVFVCGSGLGRAKENRANARTNIFKLKNGVHESVPRMRS